MRKRFVQPVSLVNRFPKFWPILFFVAALLIASGTHAQEIRVAFIAGPNQAPKVRETLERFTLESGIKVAAVVRTDTEFKAALEGWLKNEVDAPEVFFWQSSQRLFQFAEKDLLYPLTSFWNSERLDRDFSHVKTSVVFNQDVYAIPISYYHWGIYFKTSLVNRYGGPPSTWKDMLKIGARMKKDGIYPFGLGNKELWPAAAWFDYLNLRMNGLDFHRQLLAGKVSFREKRVRVVFEELKKAIDLKYFEPNVLFSEHGDIFPLLYREKIGFTLMSNGITARIPAHVLPQIGFMAFPDINPLHRYEEAPMDVLMVSKYTKNKRQVLDFLRFMARPDIQAEHNARMGYLPPNRRSSVIEGPFAKEGASLLRNSSGVSQYFDRDTVPEFEKAALPILADFFATGNSKLAIERIEAARLNVFKR